MSKSTNLKVVGGVWVEFDYTVTFGSKVFSGSHRKLIQGKTKKEFGEDDIQKAIESCITGIIEKVIKENPASIDLEKDLHTANFDADNVRFGEFGTDFTITQK